MTALLLQLWPYILGAIVAAFGAWKIRQSGVNAERAKQATAEASARSEAQAIDDAIAGRSPSANRDELRKWGPK